MNAPSRPAAEPVSHWIATAPSPAHDRLDRDLTVDVAVVGAGIAGVCTAWEVARAGRSVALLDAATVVGGVTGHTTGKLTSLHTLMYDRLARQRGPDVAALHARAQQGALARVTEVAGELGIECELETRAAYTYVLRPAGVPKVRAEAEAARAAGLPASFVTGTGLPFPVAGAVRVEDQLQFHPRAYLLGLVADLLRLGGVVHERTRVVGLREGDPCRLATERGPVVRARDVVVATQYPVFDRALLFGRLEPHRELVVAAEIAAADDPGGMYLTPEDRTRSVRTAPYGDADGGRRLLVVTGESFRPGAGEVGERYARLSAWTAEHFPGAVPRYRWSAQDDDPAGGLPYVGPFHPGARHVWVATGFGGWGMSNGVMAGRLLAALITADGRTAGNPGAGETSDGEPEGDRVPPWAPIYDPRRIPGRHAVVDMLRLQGAVAADGALDHARAFAGGVGRRVEDIPRGGAAVVRDGMTFDAVHRDDDGRTHRVSARCTHLGCLVRFNDAERTWECPCHGSRFGIDGEVLQGPAVRPLEHREDPAQTDARGTDSRDETDSPEGGTGPGADDPEDGRPDA